MATTGTLREQWLATKKELEGLGMDMKLFNKGLGPALDAFEDALDKYDKSQANQAALDKARKVVASKANAAGKIVTEYMKLLMDMEKLISDKPPYKTTKDVLKKASMKLVQFSTLLMKWNRA